MFKEQFEKFVKAEELLLNGNIELALSEINHIEKNFELTTEEVIVSELLTSYILYEQNNFEDGLKVANEALKSSEELESQTLVISSFLAKIKNLLKLKEYDKTAYIIASTEKILNDLPKEKKKYEYFTQQKAILLNYKGMVSQNIGELDLAISYTEESVKLYEKIEEKYGLAEAYINLADLYSIKGELDKSLEHLQNSQEIWDEIGNKRNYAKNLMNIGNIYTDKGDLNKAREFFQQCYELCKEINEKTTIANSLGSIGINHAMRGELDEALEYLQHSLHICEEINDKQILAKNLGSIGIIHHQKGELEQAIDFYEKSLKMNKEIGNIDGTVIFLGNIGEIYRLKGELDKALFYYQQSLQVYERSGGKSIPMALALVNSGLVYQQKGELLKALDYFSQGLEIFKESGNIGRMAEVYFFEISLLVDLNRLEEANKSLAQIQQFKEGEESKYIDQLARISEAIILKTSNRAKNRAKAEDLLSQVLDEEMINYEVSLVALINLSELYITELQLTGDEEVLVEINKLMKKQLELAKEQKSYSLLVETYFLQAQLALIELNIPSAKQLFSQSLLIAEEKNLQRLAMKISSEYDYFFEDMDMWKEFTDKKPPISEKLSHTSLEENIQRMMKKRIIDPPKFIEEKPILLLIVAEEGIPLFSQYFVPEAQFNDLLVGGFLTAINNFMQEAFATKGSIERIKHQDYNLVLQFEESLRFCYVFKGPSYGAMQKLTNFIHEIKTSSNKKLVQALFNKKSSQKIKQPQKTTIEKLAKSIFISEK